MLYIIYETNIFLWTFPIHNQHQINFPPQPPNETI